MFVKVPDGASVSAVLARADTEASDGLGVMSMEGRKAWNANGGGDCERAKPEAIDFYKIHAQHLTSSAKNSLQGQPQTHGQTQRHRTG